jgi:biotin synthase
MNINDLIRKSQNGEKLSRDELIHLLSLLPDCPESYLVMAEAHRLSRELAQGKAEIHAQLALNLAPCPGNCLFCSFAQINGVFKEEIQLRPDQAIAYARQFEQDGANAVFVMTTARYPFEQFIEVSKEIKRNLKPETIFIANVGDQSYENARKMKDTGFTGVYHAIRLREGRDTSIDPEKRRESIRNFQEVGLEVGTCVEPVGPEHTNEELAEMIMFTASLDPSYSGAGRRITIPDTGMAGRGMINELRMAQIAAVTRLGMPRTVTGNCTHEPCMLGAAGGANLFWAEAGGNPRDVKERTEEGRGETVARCKAIFHECGWDVLNGPSRFYNRRKCEVGVSS